LLDKLHATGAPDTALRLRVTDSSIKARSSSIARKAQIHFSLAVLSLPGRRFSCGIAGLTISLSDRAFSYSHLEKSSAANFQPTCENCRRGGEEMSENENAAARSIIDRSALSGSDYAGIFVLGSFAAPVTFSSQQYRAFNLIWALFYSGLIKAGDSIVVVGGGLAGVTAACAAALQRCKVTLIERSSQLFHSQHGNYTRYVHPNILRWPEDGSEVNYTNFPILNWSHGTVDGIVETVEAEWRSMGIKAMFGYEVDSVGAGIDGPWLRANRISGDSGPTLHVASYKCIVLAVGFGSERTLQNVAFKSYWENDSLHQTISQGSSPVSFLVSGCGDGGLIETLRLRLMNFHHQRFVSDVLAPNLTEELKRGLLAIEADKAGLSPSQLYEAYTNLPVPESLVTAIRGRLRFDTDVVLNGPEVSPLSRQSSALNRFLAFLLIQHGGLHYQEGRLSVTSSSSESSEVTFQLKTGKQVSRNFDHIVVRHGPKGLVSDLIDPTATAAIEDISRRSPDPTTTKLWGDFYPASEVGPASPVPVLQSAVRSFEMTFAALYDSKSTETVGIAETSDGPQFVVILKPGATRSPNAPNSISGIPIEYRVSKQALADNVISASRVQIGAGIINLDEHIRNGGSDLYAAGTLACFVRTLDGETGFLSTGHALAPSSESRLGDRIAVVQGQDATVVGILSALIAPSPDTDNAEQTVDVAFVSLEPNISYSATSVGNLPLRLTGWADALPDERVFKVGYRSGFTRGRVEAIALHSFPVHYATGAIHFRELISFVGDDQFSMPGDSGALIIRDDGKALAVLVAASENVTLGFSLGVALRKLNCTLIVE
jgi:hypothetical protein